jgi:hypothetical protein
MLEFYSSSTSVVDPKRAAAECLEKALGEQGNLDCDLIIMYTAMGHNLKALVSETRKLSPNARVVGTTCAGVIGREGPDESMKALAIMAIKGGKGEFAIASKDSIVGADTYEVSARLAQDLKSKNSDINMVHFLPSGLDIFPADRAIAGIESVFGPDIPIFGGTSCDNMKSISCFQFVDDQIFERGAVAVGFADPTLEVISRANHGFKVTGMPFVVTRAEMNHIYELDGQAAWKVLADALGFPENAQPIETGVPVILAEELPPELHEEYGNTHILRSPSTKDEDNSIYGTVVLPEGTRLWLGKRDEEGMFAGVDRMVKQTLERCKGRKPVAVFHADCAARGRYSFDRVHKDEIIRRMQFPLCRDEDVPWLGMYGGGEFTMLGGRNWFHLVTSSLYVIVRRDG